MKEKNLEGDFIDEKGEEYEVLITSTDNKDINLGNRKYKLQTPYNDKYTKIRRKGIFTSEIGIKSNGFAPIFTLAILVSLGTLLIAFLLWRL